MGSIDLENLTIKKTHDHLVRGDFSARELGSACLKRAEEKNQETNAFLEIFEDVIEAGDEADARIREKKKDTPLLLGIPLAIKDNILIKGRVVSCASKILSSYKASYDATAIQKLKQAGAVFLGRTNMDEFAMGSSNESSAFGGARNPHDLSRVPGGSSGGSASAVASSSSLGALGSDTGGSVRQPASFCGVVGLKPTYGRVSRFGLVAMASSLDQVGPLGKTVEDVKIIYDAISGHDPMDSTSLELEAKSYKPKAKRIGVPRHLMTEKGIDKNVLENFEASLSLLQKNNYEIVDIELPHITYALPAYYILMPAEASTNLARFDGVRYGFHEEGGSVTEDYMNTRGAGFGMEVRRRILLGTYVLSHGYYDAYYSKARDTRVLIKKEFGDVFSRGVDCIATPTTPSPAFKIGEVKDPLHMYFADMFTIPANIAGIPAISVPSGTVLRDGKMLPVGIQFMAAWGEEESLFEVGGAFERFFKS